MIQAHLVLTGLTLLAAVFGMVVTIATNFVIQWPTPFVSITSANVVIGIAKIIGIGAVIRNVLPSIKGTFAVGIAAAVLLIITLIQGQNLIYSIIIGIVSVYGYFVTENIGRVNWKTGIAEVLWYIFLRKTPKP